MKCLILRQGITDLITLDKGITLVQQYCQTIGLTLDFTVRDTTKQFTSIPVTSDVVKNGFIVNPTEIFQETKATGLQFDIDCLIYDWTKITPQPTNPDDGGMNLQIPMQWYTTYENVFAEFFLHELSHFLHQATNQPVDNTHLKYDPKWNGQFSQKSNIDYYLFLLKPLIPLYNPLPNAPQSPTVTLTRNIDDGIETLGTFTTGDKGFSCRTLELAWKLNQVNVSCIPRGQYTVSWRFMLRELRYRYQILNVPNRTGIYFHQGSYWFDSEGCIILGSVPQDSNSDGQLDLINTKTITDSFENYMKHKDFTLLIQ